MDLFKAIFASSSDEKSSSSSEGESSDEEEEKVTKEDEGKVDSEPLNLFSIPSSSSATTSSSHRAGTLSLLNHLNLSSNLTSLSSVTLLTLLCFFKSSSFHSGLRTGRGGVWAEAAASLGCSE